MIKEIKITQYRKLKNITLNFSPTINAISGASPVWQTLLSLLILYACAFFSVMIAGKLYSSSMLLKGKQFTPKDILTFIRS